MKVNELIKILSAMPAYADVVIDSNEEFKNFTVDAGDDYPETKTALVKLTPL